MKFERTISLTKCAKQHCLLWLPKQWLRTVWLEEETWTSTLDVDQLKLREMTPDFAEESGEGGSDTSSVQKLAESLSSILLQSELAKEKVRRVNEPRIPPREASGRVHRRKWQAIASRGRRPRM